MAMCFLFLSFWYVYQKVANLYIGYNMFVITPVTKHL